VAMLGLLRTSVVLAMGNVRARDRCRDPLGRGRAGPAAPRRGLLARRHSFCTCPRDSGRSGHDPSRQRRGPCQAVARAAGRPRNPAAAPLRQVCGDQGSIMTPECRVLP